MKTTKPVFLDAKNPENCPYFKSINRLIKSPEILKSINSVLTYRMFLNFHKKTLDEIRKNPRVEIEIDDIIQGELKGDMYRQIDNALAELKSITLKQIDTSDTVNSIKYVSLFRETGYTKKYGRKVLWVLIEEKAFPTLEHLLFDGYTKILSSETKTIPTIHGTRTYELLSMLSGFTDNAYFTLDKWKNYVGIPKTKYPKWPQLKQRIIEPDKNIINSNTSLSYDYKPKFVKRKVVGVHLINIKNNSNQWDHSCPHVKIVNEHVWSTHRDQILENYPPEHIEYYHKKCHKIADSGKIADLNSFIYKAITEDKDDYKTLLKNKKIKKTSEQKIKEAKEREIAESEHFYNFSKDCYELLSDVQKETYEFGIMGFTDRSIVLSIAISKFSKDNEDLLRESKNPEEFIRVFNNINNDT